MKKLLNAILILCIHENVKRSKCRLLFSQICDFVYLCLIFGNSDIIRILCKNSGVEKFEDTRLLHKMKEKNCEVVNSK